MKSIILLLLVLALPWCCGAQADNQRPMESLDSMSLEEILWKNVDSLRMQLYLESEQSAQHHKMQQLSLDALQRDARFQQAVEEIELRKGDLKKAGVIPDILEPVNNLDSRYDGPSGYADGHIALLIDADDTSNCPFQRRIAANDARMAQLYPYTSKSIRMGTLGIVYIKRPYRQMLMPAPIDFPPFYNAQKANLERKRQIADEYLFFITHTCEPSGCYDKKLFEEYYRYEREQVHPDALDKLIEMRRKFIAILRTTKCRA